MKPVKTKTFLIRGRLLILPPALLVVAGLCLDCFPRVKLGPGDHEQFIRQGEYKRRYIVHKPKRKPKGKRPLLIAMHGGHGRPEAMMRLTKNGINKLADKYGWYVVYPEGIDNQWNDGRAGMKDKSVAHKKNIDDVGFITSMIDKTAARYPVDAGRVYATGISNGGFMSMRLACDIPGRIQAIAVVTAGVSVSLKKKCKTGLPISVMVINGTDDPIFPYKGGDVKGKRGKTLSTDDTIKLWVKRNRCTAPPVKSDIKNKADDGTSTKVTTYTCATGKQVVLYKVKGGGHTWPGGWQYLPEIMIGKTSEDFRAEQHIFKFFGAGK